MQPGYLALHESGLLRSRAEECLARLERCDLCPRACGVNRLSGETGYCGVGRWARVASHGPHYGEEECLVGEGGSGAVFFSGCNLGCVFCQNDDISHYPDSGREMTARELAGVMFDLQDQGVSNINLVTPSHVAAQILEALVLAAANGLRLPLVYNSGGYDSLATLTLLRGVVDIYMPDVKYWEPSVAARLCGAWDYPDMARKALKAMHAQVGDLRIDDTGVAQRGLLVRHLVLPGGLAGTGGWMRFLAEELSPETYVNVMSQYHPCAQARLHPPLDRAVTDEECRRAVQEALAAGITRLDERKGTHLEAMLRRLLR